MGRTTCTEPQCLYKGDLYLYLYLYPCNAEDSTLSNVLHTMPVPAVQASTLRCVSSVVVLKRPGLFREWWQCGLQVTMNDTWSPLAIEDIWLGYFVAQGAQTHKQTYRALTQREGSSAKYSEGTRLHSLITSQHDSVAALSLLSGECVAITSEGK